MKTFRFQGMKTLHTKAREALEKEYILYSTLEGSLSSNTKSVRRKLDVKTSDSDDEFGCMDITFDEEVEESVSSYFLGSTECSPIQEVLKYYDLPPVPGKPMELIKEFNAMEWWINRAADFPILSKIALRYLVTPCASSFCERIFSGGGLISSMCQGITIERRIQISHNLHLVQSNCGLLSGSSMAMNLQSVGTVDDVMSDSLQDIDNDDELE